MTDRLLALTEFRLRILDWRKTKDGHHGRNVPKPLPMPDDKPIEPQFTPMSVDEMNEFLGW